ncbi:MAG: hypothetical protein WCL45_09885, partial [Polynucleobacter sp.]
MNLKQVFFCMISALQQVLGTRELAHRNLPFIGNLLQRFCAHTNFIQVQIRTIFDSVKNQLLEICRTFFTGFGAPFLPSQFLENNTQNPAQNFAKFLTHLLSKIEIKKKTIFVSISNTVFGALFSSFIS